MDETIQVGGKKPKNNTAVAIWLLAATLLIALGFVGWLVWMMMSWNTERTALVNDKSKLEQQVKLLSEQLNLAKSGEATPKTAACDGTITDAFKADIKAAIEAHNYAALEPSMASTVRVTIAASEGVGDRTPAEAVGDMVYLNNGTLPWDFNLPAATLANYDAGFYTSHFDTNTVVGRAANGIVVAIDFDDCAKINKVFMSVHEDLLMP